MDLATGNHSELGFRLRSAHELLVGLGEQPGTGYPRAAAHAGSPAPSSPAAAWAGASSPSPPGRAGALAHALEAAGAAQVHITVVGGTA